MYYEITNEFGYNKDYDYLNDVIKETLKIEKVNNALFDIIFVDNAKIKELNKNYRDIDSITDVISFAFEDNLDITYPDIRFLGEIYICIPRMQEQALEYGHSEKRELSFLVVHGLLHLRGYDHMNKEDEVMMFARQDLILNSLNIKK